MFGNSKFNYYLQMIKSRKLYVGGNKLPTPRDPSTIPKQYCFKVIIYPEKIIQEAHMDTGFGDCIPLRGNQCILIVIEWSTQYAWVYIILSLSQDMILMLLFLNS